MSDIQRRHDSAAVGADDLAAALNLSHLLVEIRRRGRELLALIIRTADEELPVEYGDLDAVVSRRLHLLLLQ